MMFFTLVFLFGGVTTTWALLCKAAALLLQHDEQCIQHVQLCTATKLCFHCCVYHLIFILSSSPLVTHRSAACVKELSGSVQPLTIHFNREKVSASAHFLIDFELKKKTY